MRLDLTGFFQLIGAIRKKSIELSPVGLSPLLGVTSNKFVLEGEWQLRDTFVEGVSFDLWIHSSNGQLTANFWLSDFRLGFEECARILSEVFGPVDYVKSSKRPSGWIVYDETDLLRQASFIFGGNEEKLYLEMIVLGLPFR